MKYKIFIFILTLTVYLLPIGASGFFAVPDDHVYSSPFGVQQKETKAVRPSIPSAGVNLPSNSVNFNNNGNELQDTNQPLVDFAGFSEASRKNNSLFWQNFVLITILILLIAALIFLLAKNISKREWEF